MKLRSLLPALVALNFAAAQPSSIPHLEKRGSATQLIVDGRPFLMLAGEVTNSASSSLDYLAPYWPELAAAHLNTVLAAVSWELVEPQPGAFDFSLVDGMIREARRHDLRLVFLWFGSWKNGVSTYTPLWVKRDPKQFPLFLAENGVTLTYLSVFHDANWKADARAFAALMRHIRDVDGDAHTVIMVQVENEVGCPGGTRDHSPEGNAAFDRPVPRQLLDYMAKNRAALIPEFRAVWEAAGARTTGNWQEVFGKDPVTNEIFMAWNYASYLDKVARAGKAEYALPMFVNAALGEKIGQYSAGGPLPIVLNVWQQGAPSIDVVAPDIYLPDFAEWCARYNRSGNPLWIPETRADAANAFYAIGKHAAMGISPFAIERSAGAATPYARAYEALAQAAPAILKAQSENAIGAVVLTADKPAQSLPLGSYTLDFAIGRARRPPAPTPAPAAQPSSFAIAISTGPDDYVIVGNGVQLTFTPNGPEPSTAAIGALEEGVYVDGRWVPGRRLNGDDIMVNYNAQNQAMKGTSGQGLRLAGDAPRILHVKLYRY
ncbi:MAG TPA: DUF5597 domain-containing protein [Bryobacteraceae bacterium]|nr:DUF5597 domain-containing protein [Bryobacteraceae bacterium]